MPITTFSEYVRFAAQFESDAGAPHSVSDRARWRAEHALLGLVTEAAELVEWLQGSARPLTNLIEELGDLSWYTALLASALMQPGIIELPWSELDEAATEFSDDPSAECLSELWLRIGDLADVLKRRRHYRDFGVKGEWSRIPLASIVHGLAALSRALLVENAATVTLTDVWDANIRKLSARYPNLAFSAEHAVTRDLAAEVRALEG